MTKEHSLLGQFFFAGNPSRAQREEKVLRYIIHRIDEDAAFPEVLGEPYVRRNCSEGEIHVSPRTPAAAARRTRPGCPASRPARP